MIWLHCKGWRMVQIKILASISIHLRIALILDIITQFQAISSNGKFHVEEGCLPPLGNRSLVE